MKNTILSKWELIENNPNNLIENSQKINSVESNLNLNKNGVLPICAERLPEVPGTHIIKYESEVDSIEIRHDAKNRLGFAMGAVVGAGAGRGQQAGGGEQGLERHGSSLLSVGWDGDHFSHSALAGSPL